MNCQATKIAKSTLNQLCAIQVSECVCVGECSLEVTTCDAYFCALAGDRGGTPSGIINTSGCHLKLFYMKWGARNLLLIFSPAIC